MINSQFSGGNINDKIDCFKKILHLGIYSNAHCGGFLNFYKLKGNKNNEYVIFYGVNEISISHYRAFL